MQNDTEIHCLMPIIADYFLKKRMHMIIIIVPCNVVCTSHIAPSIAFADIGLFSLNEIVAALQ